MADPITTYYADNPWEVVTEKERSWLDPTLIDLYQKNAVFAGLVPFVKSFADVRATSMSVTQLLEAHPDYTPLSMRQLWMNAAHLDSRSITIDFQHYGGKFAFHKYDDMVTYWQTNNRAGLKAIVQRSVGRHSVDVIDMLARNAFLKGSLESGYVLYAGDATNFGNIGTGTEKDKFDPFIGADIWLGMTSREVTGARGPSGAGGYLLCYTTPGVIYDIQRNEEWVDVHRYQGMVQLVNYEVGSFKNVRYVQNPKLTLYNCGSITAQAPLSAPRGAQDGALAKNLKVDGTYNVGQSGVIPNLQLGTFVTGTIANLAVNDIVTIHLTRTNSFGVTNGVNPFEGTAVNRRIVAIDTDNGRISLDRPLMIDFNTDLGSGVYGYVTKAVHIHPSIFIGGPNGIVSGVSAPPQFYALDPIDDFNAMYRFTWDAYMGYSTFTPEVFETVFSSGSTRYKGKTLTP